MSTTLALGTSDFREMRRPGVFYADKTHLLRDFLDTEDKAVLFARPRRFGKTAALSMMRAFFEKSADNVAPLFHDLAIWQAGAAYLTHFQRYPVLHMSFKETKALSWQKCERAVILELSRAAAEHRDLLTGGVLSKDEAERLRMLIEGQLSDADSWATLRLLCSLLHRHHGQPVLVLIDEYDAPILAGYQHGFFEDVCIFFRNLLSSLLKDNRDLFRGVLTGILRIAKEDMFSGPNNVTTYDMLSPEFATAFGFTQEDVCDLLHRIGQLDKLAEVQSWYNGYLIGDKVIYNPWSVLHFARRPGQGCQPYWIHTGSDDVLRTHVLNLPYSVVDEIRQLLLGTTITKHMDRHVTLRELSSIKGAVWGLLLASGYLKVEAVRNEEGRIMADLAIPNKEVRTVYTHGILRWLGSGDEGEDPLDQLQQALLGGDTETFAGLLSGLAQRVLSFHDTGGRAPEKVYQAFALGILTRLLKHYDIDSNREGGLGRYDILVMPRTKGKPGAVLEFKVAHAATKQAVQKALSEALLQIKAKGYAQRLRDQGADPIRCYAVACHGKQLWVQQATLRKLSAPKRPPRKR